MPQGGVGVKPTAGVSGILGLDCKTKPPDQVTGRAVIRKVAALVGGYLRRLAIRHMATPMTDRAIVLGSGTSTCEIV